MKKFFVLTHESKHGEDLTFHDTLDEAFKEADSLVKQWHPTCQSYKDVKNEGGPSDDMYITSFETDNLSITKEQLKSIWRILSGLDYRETKVEDNDIDSLIPNYPKLEAFLKKFDLKIERLIETVPYYNDKYLYLVDKNNSSKVCHSTEKLKNSSIESSSIFSGVFNKHWDWERALLRIEIENDHDFRSTLETLEESMRELNLDNLNKVEITSDNGLLTLIKKS